jgi:hypothetical protein
VVDQPLFDLLQTIPGVGKILGLTIFYEVGDIGRFQSPKHFCSYARVVPGSSPGHQISRLYQKIQAKASSQKTIQGQKAYLPMYRGPQTGYWCLLCSQR